MAHRTAGLLMTRPAMQEVADWLRKLGVDQYAESFAQHDIDFSILPDLSDQDLKELGVASLGHRRQLFRAIAELTHGEPSLSKTIAELTAPTAPRDPAERRHVTVMFSDLVGSTALSARLDPEDLREVISAYQECVAETVQRFDGFVAKYMGDGVLIYFGYPQAREDDAERAVRAGLELVAAVGALKSHAPLQTRVGIATGLVIVGDLIGSGASQEQAIVGETPNLAARLQSIAEPNGVIIAENTRKLVGNLFEIEDLGALELKGISERTQVWAALRPSSVESRFDALRAGALNELVGREEELDLLLRRWSKAKAGVGQVVLLSGEPGIGKSRLTSALMGSLDNEPHTRLRYFCSPQHTESALYPIISQMERAAGFSHNDSPRAKLDKLDALLTQSSASQRDAALLAEMLSLPTNGHYPLLELVPQQRREKTLEALSAQLEALSRSKPLLMVFEDVHWVDPTSLEALNRIIDQVRTLGVLLIVTHRPEFEAHWIGRPYVTALNLNRLGDREAAAIIDRVRGSKPLPADIRRDIIERTDGIPLFVEEMTTAVLEAENESEARKTAGAVPPAALPVPASLYASLMSRLDRLGPAREVAQVGSAIGREFSHALLAAATGKPETILGSVLDRLIAAGLLFRQGVPPHATYLFKHALVQDAAYGSLLRETRRALHKKIAGAIQSQFADAAENQPELLAHHYTAAGLIEQALIMWTKAGRRSLQRSALVEATLQFNRALDQIATLSSTPALRRERISVQIELANALMHLKGYAAGDTVAALKQAQSLIEAAQALNEPPEDPLQLFSILHGMWAANRVAFNGGAMRQLSAQFLALAERQKADTVVLMNGHRVVGISLLLTGDISGGRAHLNEAVALYKPAEHGPMATRFGADVAISVLSYRAIALWLLGYPANAQADINHVLLRARDLGQAGSLMFALCHTSLIHIHVGNYESALTDANECISLAENKNSPFWKALASLMRGCLLSLRGSDFDAIQAITQGIVALRSTGSTGFLPMILPYLAAAYARLKEINEASRAIGEAITAAASTMEIWCDAEILRVSGVMELARGNSDKAQKDFERALAIARQQQAKSWELRVSMSLARLWRDRGKPQQARELLAPVYGWFTEGFDTRDLKEAKALLEELAS